jgi:heme/copper-type cytochrome/quinol oxidase subunit 2
MKSYQLVIWAIVLVLVPVIGLVAYLLWRIARSDAMQDSMDYEEELPGWSGRRPRLGKD